MMQLASTLGYYLGVGSWMQFGHTAVGSLPEGPRSAAFPQGHPRPR